jgi:hypothetical protein
VVGRLTAAAEAVDGKQWQHVLELVGDLPLDPTVSPADHGEAHRLLGIAEFYLAHYDRAEAHFHAYLKIDLDGQLDISLFSPDVVRFFDDVKAKHAAELRALRPRTRRWAVLNLMPPAGQFQNRQPVKGWILGGLGVSLIAAHVGSYMLLDGWCSDVDRTCETDGGTSRADSARTLKTVNTAAGLGLIAVYVYGVYDGFRTYRQVRGGVMVTPVALTTQHGTATGLGLSGAF